MACDEKKLADLAKTFNRCVVLEFEEDTRSPHLSSLVRPMWGVLSANIAIGGERAVSILAVVNSSAIDMCHIV